MAKAKKIPANARQFPLVDQAEQAENDLFSQHQSYEIQDRNRTRQNSRHT